MSKTSERLITTARALLSSGDPAHALRAMEALLERNLETASSCLLRAEALDAMDRTDAMCDALAHLHTLAPDDATVHRRAASLCRGRARLLLALAHIERTVRSSPGDPGGWSLLFEIQHGLHRLIEAKESLQRAVALAPDDADLAGRAARICIASRDYRGANRVVAAARDHVPDHPELTEFWADLATRLQWTGCEAAIDAAHALRPDRWWHTTDRWLALGRIDRAEALLAAEEVSQGHTPLWMATMGRMALWRGDTATATEWAQRALTLDPTLPEANLVLGGAATLLEDPARALPALNTAAENVDKATWFTLAPAHVFRAHLHDQAGETEAAVRAASRAMETATDYNVSAHVTRMLAATRRQRGFQPRADPRFIEIAHQVHDLADDPATSWTGSVSGLQRGLSDALRRMGGNRSSMTTVLTAEGHLTPYAVPPYPRHLARLLQLQIRCRSATSVLADFQALAEDHPQDSTVHTYWGELLIWLGQAEAASTHFQQAIAIDRGTTWAWIGLGAAQMLQAELEAALETWAEGIIAVNFEGPTVFVYRGETLRRMGKLDAARADLGRATRDKPHRLSAWMNLVIVRAAQGSAEPARCLAERLRQTNPGFWSDATIHARRTQESPSDVDVLTAGLDLMRGNRSSTVLSYFSPDGQLRFVRWEAGDVPAALRA